MSHAGRRCRQTLFAAAAACALGAPTLAAGQEASELEAIVVTAQLREQDPVEVPIALTAYTGEALERLGLQEFEELSLYVPGFEVQNQSPNNPGFVMRGITSDSGEATNEPRVSVFQDGVSISKSRGSYVELFDLERVEIAKGPQSTLYGRGALIGAVNLIQNKARPGEFDGAGRFEAGNHGYALGELMLNAPLGDDAALRLAVRAKDRDGYVENLLGGRDFNATKTRAARAALNWTGEALRLDVIANYQTDKPAGTAFQSLGFRPTDPLTGLALGGSASGDGAALAAGDGFPASGALGLDREVWGVTGILRWTLSPSLTLNSVTAHRQFDSLEVFDADGISLPALTAAEAAKGEQFSQDLRLNFDGGGRWRGFVGLSYFKEDGSQAAPAQFDERVLLARLTGVLNGGPAIPGRAANLPAPAGLFGATAFTAQLLQGVAGASGVLLPANLAQGIAANLKPAHREQTINLGETEAVDVYADVTFDLTDRLEVGGGLRYSRSEKTSAFGSSVLNGRSILGGFIGALAQPAATRTALLGALAVPGAANIPTSTLYPVPMFGLGAQPTLANGQVLSDDLEDEGVTWRLTARYALSGDASVYANYGRGRRPKVLSVAAPAAPYGAPRFEALAAETVDSFEVGAKAALLDRRLKLDGALFHYTYDNFQTVVQDGTLFVTTNAGEAKAYGFEGQATFAASAAFDLFATYAYNHSRFEAGVREGNRFRLSPDHTLSLGAAWRTPVAGGTLEVRPTLSWQSKVFFDDDNDRPDLQMRPRALVDDLVEDELQDAYSLVNLRVDWTAPDGRWSIGAFATNLLDERYIKDAGNTGDAIGMPTFIAGEPRFFGVTFAGRR
ncbi:TonB-dependent receptor [Phenylobacterium sp.]|jgi:outer membrane receptor protein involved in Fe transport|uniref:TonB-dependent receptor n=1 Tax=Phenylobacterium sp. TaxID=1871053 RepID=UPI0037840177